MNESIKGHTPGPWTLENRHDERGTPSGINVFSEAEATFICRMPDGASVQGGHAWPEQLANARLIAAAPELLEALSVLVDHAKETYPHFEDVRGQNDIAKALTAIAKAKGE